MEGICTRSRGGNGGVGETGDWGGVGVGVGGEAKALL